MAAVEFEAYARREAEHSADVMSNERFISRIIVLPDYFVLP